ncbi:MAG: DUF4329 domain-containing protein [Gammaproteobacteria bacterium]
MATRTVVLVLACSAVFLIFGGRASAAPEVPTAGPLGPAFTTELNAVIAATSAVNGRSIREDREFLGAVLRRGSDFHYSIVTGQPGVDRIRARLIVPEGFELVAVWHTHGAAATEHRFFSRVDAALVAGTGKPLYLADHTGALRVLQPGAPRLSAIAARRLGLPGRSGFATGEQLRGTEGELVRIPTRAEPALARVVNN